MVDQVCDDRARHVEKVDGDVDDRGHSGARRQPGSEPLSFHRASSASCFPDFITVLLGCSAA
eukprot:342169-Pleurochrysis_carterae.AAC.3